MLRAVDKIKGKTPANPQASTSAAKQHTPPPIITVGKQLPMTTEIIKGIKEHTTGFFVKHNNKSSLIQPQTNEDHEKIHTILNECKIEHYTFTKRRKRAAFCHKRIRF
ncbi:hypothetical protein JTB14_026822 [Gonioctena quinquepunctata]|nr:hypothetical protein JTB14_026822 [Gonioctena quinquepunctata]